jgi:radical SAM superfamily enzyme YgiQ (UPF0313 family)
MKEIAERKDRPLFRVIIPAFPWDNIFTEIAKSMTALGPIMVATAANKVWGWRVEVVDENNYEGPRNSRGLPNHEVLQARNPAMVVGFYCGLSSTIPRVLELASFYHGFSATVAGGWHAHYCPEEMLNGGIDVVVHGAGEEIIQMILGAIAGNGSFADIPGISFWESGQPKTNPPEMLQIRDLDDLPYPDFGLLKWAGRIRHYPTGRIRGCGMKCEFCSVKGKPHWSTPRHLFETVDWLVETRKARHFFLVDDRSEEDLTGTIEFFEMISERYGKRLGFTVQMRLEAAKNTELLEAMRKAGVRTVCIGFESPIDEELKAMHKGYSSASMLEWVRIWRSYGFRIHGMFIFGYPLEETRGLVTAKEMAREFKRFIRKSRIDSVQILHPVPLVGTALRRRLIEEGRIFPLEVVPWDRYDGSYPCFRPNNMTLRELQEIPVKLMKWFYNPMSFIKILLKTVTFPVDYLIRGWDNWHRHWLRDIIRCGGHHLIRRWQRRQGNDVFIEKLEKYENK